MKNDDIICFTNGQIFHPEGFVTGSLCVQNGKIIPLQKAHRFIDCKGGFVAPGLIDLQVNGIADVDFSVSLDRLDVAARLLAKTGVTSFLATIISQAPERYQNCLAEYRQDVSQCIGLHFEGPYLHPTRYGAHPQECLATQWEKAYWEKLLASAKIKMVTLAPELSGMQAFIDLLCQQNVLVFAGHTNATTDELEKTAGLTGVTHLYNAMRPFHQRDPGPIGYVLGQKKLLYSLIVDGEHLHKDSVLMAYNAHPKGLLLVSDLRATTLGGRKVTGLLKASTHTLLEGVRNLCLQTACPLHQAIYAASTRQAMLLGLPKGLLEPGYDADVIILDQNLCLQATYVTGKEIFS